MNNEFEKWKKAALEVTDPLSPSVRAELDRIESLNKSLQPFQAPPFVVQQMQQQREREDRMQLAAEETAKRLGSIADSQYKRDNPVVEVAEELLTYIKEFEETLAPNEEVGARLVSFNQEIKFHIRNLGYATPCILHFDGVTDSGHRVRLVQHISQLNVLFIAMPLKEGEERKPIGFIHD